MIFLFVYVAGYHSGNAANVLLGNNWYEHVFLVTDIVRGCVCPDLVSKRVATLHDNVTICMLLPIASCIYGSTDLSENLSFRVLHSDRFQACEPVLTEQFARVGDGAGIVQESSDEFSLVCLLKYMCVYVCRSNPLTSQSGSAS